MPRARVNGIDTSYEVTGTGSPVLFIHGGFGGPATTLAPQERAVRSVLRHEAIQLVTYDRRCAGLSQYVLDDYTLVDLAGDARALLAHLGIERSVVIGDSMGGMVALQYALMFPRRVSALCLIETGAALMSETAFGRQGRELVARARGEGDRALFEARKEQLRHPPAPAEAPGRGEEMRARAQAQREALLAALATVPDEDLFRYSTGMVRNYAAFLGCNLAPRLHELKMPVCIIHGNADTTVPFAYSQALHAAMPRSEFHDIPGAIHGMFAFPRAAEALRDWVLRMIAADREGS